MVSLDLREKLDAERFQFIATSRSHHVIAYPVEIQIEKLIAKVAHGEAGGKVMRPDRTSALRTTYCRFERMALTAQHEDLLASDGARCWLVISFAPEVQYLIG